MTIATYLERFDKQSPGFKLLALQTVAITGFVQGSALVQFRRGEIDTLTIRREPKWPINHPLEIIP